MKSRIEPWGSDRLNISAYTHENQTKYSSLQHIDWDQPIGHLFKTEFVRNKLISEQQVKDRMIEIWFIFKSANVVHVSLPSLYLPLMINSFQQIMMMSINWTPALLQETPRSTDHRAERLLDLQKLAIYLPFLKLLMLLSQRRHSTLDRLSSEAPFDLPKGLLEWKSGHAIQKQSNATSNELLPNSFRKGLSVAKSLWKYQQRGKLFHWQVHLSLKRLEILVTLVKASLNAGYMCVFFSYFTSTRHLICKLQGQVWRSWICCDISGQLNNDQRKHEDHSWSRIQASLPMWLIQSSIQ